MQMFVHLSIFLVQNIMKHVDTMENFTMFECYCMPSDPNGINNKITMKYPYHFYEKNDDPH